MRRKTLGSLYNDRLKTQWYWRLLGTLSASLILLGFLVFPTSFPTTTQTKTDQNTLSITAVILLALGYSLSVALWFICRSWLFQFDVLFMPCLFSCVLGAVNVLISIGVHPEASTQWTASPIAALVLALASSAAYAGLGFYVWRQIDLVRERDPVKGFAVSDQPEDPSLISESEQQQKQWHNLLQRQNSANYFANSNQQAHNVAATYGSSGYHTGAGGNTYHVAIPDDARLARNNTTISSTSPTSNPGGRSISPYPDTVSSGTYDPYSATSLTTPGAYDPLAADGGITRLNPHHGHLNPQQQALQQARERTLHNARSRERIEAANQQQEPPQSQVQAARGFHQGWSQGQGQQSRRERHAQLRVDIPLSEVHPLERDEVARRRGNQLPDEGPGGAPAGLDDKHDKFRGAVYRPDSSAANNNGAGGAEEGNNGAGSSSNNNNNNAADDDESSDDDDAARNNSGSSAARRSQGGSRAGGRSGAASRAGGGSRAGQRADGSEQPADGEAAYEIVEGGDLVVDLGAVRRAGTMKNAAAAVATMSSQHQVRGPSPENFNPTELEAREPRINVRDSGASWDEEEGKRK